jgi:hypothetical protein
VVTESTVQHSWEGAVSDERAQEILGYIWTLEGGGERAALTDLVWVC